MEGFWWLLLTDSVCFFEHGAGHWNQRCRLFLFCIFMQLPLSVLYTQTAACNTAVSSDPRRTRKVILFNAKIENLPAAFYQRGVCGRLSFMRFSKNHWCVLSLFLARVVYAWYDDASTPLSHSGKRCFFCNDTESSDFCVSGGGDCGSVGTTFHDVGPTSRLSELDRSFQWEACSRTAVVGFNQRADYHAGCSICPLGQCDETWFTIQGVAGFGIYLACVVRFRCLLVWVWMLPPKVVRWTCSW